MISCYSPCCCEQADNQRLRKAILTFFFLHFLLVRPISFSESEKRPREFREQFYSNVWRVATRRRSWLLAFYFPLATGFVLYSIFFFLGIYLISESFVVDGYCPLEDDTRRCIFLGCYFYFFELKTSSVLVTASYLPAGLPSGLIDHTYRPEVAVSFFFFIC